MYSVPARHISEGAAPCLYCLAPCPIIQRPARIKKKELFIDLFKNFIYLQNVIAVFVFSDVGVKMLVKSCRFVPMFSSIAHKIVPDLVSFMCWIATQFCHSRSVPDYVSFAH